MSRLRALHALARGVSRTESWHEERYRRIESLYGNAVGLLDEILFYGTPEDLPERVKGIRAKRALLVRFEEMTRP